MTNLERQGFWVPNERYGDLPYFRASQWDVLHAPAAGSVGVLTMLGGNAPTPAWNIAPSVGAILHASASGVLGWIAAGSGTGAALRSTGAGAAPAYGAAAFTAWTPTITSGTGTLTTVSASGGYLLDGKLFTFHLLITVTTNGTGASWLQFSLPNSLLANGAQACSGVKTNASTAESVWIQDATGVVTVFNADGSYPGGDGTFHVVSGTIEVA